MNNNDIYKSRMVAGMAVIAMPKGTAGIKYTRTEGKGGVIYLRPVKQFKPRETQIKEAEKNRIDDEAMAEVDDHGDD